MTGIFDQSGRLTPYYDLQDGSGEQRPAAVYVNKQDGSGEIQVWPTYLEDWNDGTTGWSSPIDTTTTNPVTDDVSENLSDVHGYTSPSSSGYAGSANSDITIAAGEGVIRYYTRSGGAGAGADENQFNFARQSSDPSNRYRFTIYSGQNGAYLHKYTNGGGTKTTLFAKGSDVFIDAEEWALVEIRWDSDGYIEARVKNVSTGQGPQTIGSTTDTTYSDGSVSIATYHGSSVSHTHMDGLEVVDSFTI